MINNFISNMVNNLPENFNNTYNNSSIHIVFEGGLFNGSYLTGCLFYLKELEKRKYIKINKLSGCSIGSIVALLYYINDEKIIMDIYKLAYQHFKETYNVNIFTKIFTIIKNNLPKNIIKLINKKIYISYFNIKYKKYIIKSKYKNIEDLFETIRKSCSFPYIIDNQLFYKKKYIDGLYPHIFKPSNKNRILYLNIHNINKIGGMLSIKNEVSNYQRVLDGILEADIFFRYNNNTSICSFIDKWNLIDIFFYKIFIIFIYIIIFILNKFYIIHNLIVKSYKYNNINLKCLLYNIYILFLDSYCV